MRKKTILIVDDNPVIRRFIQDLLLKQGYLVHCAEDALTCLDLLPVAKPDIIIIDLIMPGIGGDDLCRIIRKIKGMEDIYLILITATAMEQNIDFIRFGANACIAKGPFGQMESHLLEAIGEANAHSSKSISETIRGKDDLQFRHITKELLDSSRHFQIVLEYMSQGILELKNNRIVYTNPMAITILRTPKEQLLGSDLRDILPPVLIHTILESQGESSTYEPLHIGERQITVEQFLLKPTCPNRIILLTDVTEKRKMESVIEAANLTKNLGYVFSGIRHEIGNPLNSIKMALSVLQRNVHEYEKETILEFLERALQEVARLEYLLRTLKSYSLFEKPDMQVVSVSDFIHDFVTLIRNDFEDKQIRIQTIIADNDLFVWADNRALHHIMLNLITNAVDALEEEQKPQISISAVSNDAWVNIKIDDNGKGISEQDQQHLFQPFFTSKASGTGLGLVIVQKMLAAMGGRIHVESYLSLGTTVTISLQRPKAHHRKV